MTDIAYHPTRLRAVRDSFRALRAAEFPWTAGTVDLNNAAIGPIPERTRRTLDEFTAKRTAPRLLPDRERLAGLQSAREALAQLINAETGEIALATNTSYGLNLAARALPLSPGDVVLVSDREFPANVYPWLLLKKQGIDVELAPCVAEGWRTRGCGCWRCLSCSSPTATAPTWPAWAPPAAPTARSSWWTGSRVWATPCSTCGRRPWTCSPAAARNGCSHRGARDSCTCARSSWPCWSRR